MPLEQYGVFVGRPVLRTLDRDRRAPHYHLLLDAGGAPFHVAVNMRSAVDRADLLYLIDAELRHPLTERWAELPLGFTRLAPTPASGAIDFIRAQIVDRRRFRIAPRAGRGGRGLVDLLDAYVNRAIADPDALVYAFGARWGPKPDEIDRTFRRRPIQPSDGMHNVHMNQGSVDQPGPRDNRYHAENGPWQDGALLVRFPEQDEWIGIFLAFQSQLWHSDDRTGHPALRPERSGRCRRPAGDEPDFRLRLVSALVNPVGPAPERETVTLLNPFPEPVDLHGWSIANTDRQRTSLSGEIAPGETRIVTISPDAPLGNSGGTITLLDPRGLKVDGVAYTRRQAEREGVTLMFGRE